MGKHRVTVDTGGTFSDFVCLDEDTGAISIAKLPATPDDPSRAILGGIETLRAGGVAPEDITFFCHSLPDKSRIALFVVKVIDQEAERVFADLPPV